MKITEILNESKKPFPSIEIVPPLNGMSKDELLGTIRSFMEFAPKYINVTCHRDEYAFREEANGTYSRHLVRNRISEVAVCAAIMSEFDVNVVPHPEGYAHANELVEAIRRFDEQTGESFCIGVGGYPEKHFECANIETDIENLKRKVDAGADYIITQMFFDNKVFYRFVDLCRKAGINVPIIPGLKPISTARQVALLPQSFSLDIPKELTEAIATAGDDKEEVYRIGTQWCTAQCKDLLAHGVPAVHFYTMGKPRNITEIMRECF